jgi:UDP-glucose 4-epimerase
VKSPKYTKKVDVGNFVVDNSKLRKLGWKQKFSFEEGIKKTLDHFSI